MQLGHAWRGHLVARVDSEHLHSEGSGEPSSLRADAAHPNDERCSLGQVDHPGVERRRKPFAIQLLRQIPMQSAREGEDKCHDVRADMVIENFAEICHNRGVRNQLRVVPARRRSRLGGLNPAKLGSCSQEGRGDSAKCRIRPCDGARGFGLILGDDDRHVRLRGGKTLRPLARGRSLRRKHEQSRCHRQVTLRVFNELA